MNYNNISIYKAHVSKAEFEILPFCLINYRAD